MSQSDWRHSYETWGMRKFPLYFKNNNLTNKQMKRTVLLLVILVATVSCESKSSRILKDRKHNISFKWIGTDKSIPKDGTLIKILGTDENTVFIGPADSYITQDEPILEYNE